MKEFFIIILVVIAFLMVAISHEGDMKNYYVEHGYLDKNITFLNWSTK